MANIHDSLAKLMTIDGAIGVALVDSGSGMALGTLGTGLDLELAAAGNTEVVRAKLKTIAALGLTESIDDILITLSSQYHIIRPLAAAPEVFIYIALDKARGNLALARLSTREVEKQLEL